MHASAGRDGIRVPGTRYNDKLSLAHDLLPLIPGADFREGVGANDEEDFARIRLRFDALDRVNRITLLAPFFEAGRNESGLACAGQLHHFVAILIARTGFLVRRIRGRDEQDTIQRKGIGRLARHDQVGAMNGIEGSSENRRPHKMCWRNSPSLSISIPIFSHSSVEGAMIAETWSHKFIMSFSVVTRISAPKSRACWTSRSSSAGR